MLRPRKAAAFVCRYSKVACNTACTQLYTHSGLEVAERPGQAVAEKSNYSQDGGDEYVYDATRYLYVV